MINNSNNSKVIKLVIYNCIRAILNPIQVVRNLLAYPRYFNERRRYSQMAGAEKLRVIDSYPCLNDRTCTTRIDPHYFYVNGWAMRRILSLQPKMHWDIGSQTMFVNLLSAVVPVTFIDYRPLEVGMSGLTNQGGDILNLSIADNMLSSLSCLHVAEHIGLGRYGDPLNPNGTKQACDELQRILAPGGNLFFALPVGIERVCFNSHRVHDPYTIRRYFADLELVEFSGVDDDGSYVEHVDLGHFVDSRYSCGMFWFRKV